jgi:hypothetical protein
MRKRRRRHDDAHRPMRSRKSQAGQSNLCPVCGVAWGRHLCPGSPITVTTLDDVVKVYGSELKLRKAFGLSRKDLEGWRAHGVPQGHHLGLYLGLQARGREPSPRLFGVRSWREFPGA